mgnify:FL=1
MGVKDTEVSLGLHPHKLVTNESHLQLVSTGVGLEVLSHGGRVGATWVKTRKGEIIMNLSLDSFETSATRRILDRLAAYEN